MAFARGELEVADGDVVEEELAFGAVVLVVVGYPGIADEILGLQRLR